MKSADELDVTIQKASDCASAASNDACRDIEGMYAFSNVPVSAVRVVSDMKRVSEPSGAETRTIEAHVVATVPSEDGMHAICSRERPLGEASAAEPRAADDLVVATAAPSEDVAKPVAEHKTKKKKKSERWRCDPAAWDELRKADCMP